MLVTDFENGKKIVLSKAFDSRAKVLNAFYATVFTAQTIAFSLVFLSFEEQSLLLYCIILGGIVVGALATYRFINKALKSEIIIINQNEMVILVKGFLTSKKRTFKSKQIAKFDFLLKPEAAKHPLATDNFDYLGFQTQQQVINEIYGDNRIGFEYENKTVTFGEHMYSWHFEKLQVVFKSILGSTFHFNEDFERDYIGAGDEDSEQLINPGPIENF
ncbi:MAG: hypothetical protein WC716_13085 [Chitinophagaceae bacterium]|jgi:hypothetical protein